MKFTVHIYPIVRVTCEDIEAESQQKAIQIAEKAIDFHYLLDDANENVEYAEDIDGFCVDEENDIEYENTVWYDKHSKPI